MQAQSTTERKYVLTKLAPGDYVLPSNNGNTLWRISTYTDGRINGLEHGPWSADYWQLHRWTGRVDDNEAMAQSVLDHDWDQWEWTAGSMRKRAEAIEEAMRLRGSALPERSSDEGG